jgi:predicted O-methyltransferase YrrM
VHELSQMQDSSSFLDKALSQRPESASGEKFSNGNRPLTRLARLLRENDFFTPCVSWVFHALQRIGITVIPSHYYWPVPDLRELAGRAWPGAMPIAFDLQLSRQLHFLNEIASEYGEEWTFPTQAKDKSAYHYNNGFFETVDAEIAYSFVRRYKPLRILEIGAGYSTRVLATALEANLTEDSVRGELISVDPHLDRAPESGFSNQVGLVPARVQDLDLELFQSLEKNDILFIDSSHVVGVGSDVVREVLEILPVIRPGVLIHLHDIFIPADYPRETVLKNFCFWSEQYLLQAFLSFNASFEVLWSSSAMQMFQPRALEATFPNWSSSYRDMPRATRRFLPTPDSQRVWPSSFWMRRILA